VREEERWGRERGMGNGEWGMGEGTVESERVDSGEGQWRVESGQWRVDSGEWRVDSGQWRAVGAGGERAIDGSGMALTLTVTDPH